MSRSYRLVVFDWEGTLGDTLGQILNIVTVVAERLGFGEVDEQLARECVVLGLVQAVKKLFPNLSLHQQEQLLQEVQQDLMTSSMETCLIPGAKDIIQKINEAGIALAIATNKGQQSLQRALLSAGLHDTFKVTRSAGQLPTKPCPDMLIEIMEEFGATADETLMIGDSVSDIEMAKQIGVDAVGVDFYHQQATHLQDAGALEVFDDYQQLEKYLQLNEVSL